MTAKCPNCGEVNDLKTGVTTNNLETFDYGCLDCGSVFNEEDV